MPERSAIRQSILDLIHADAPLSEDAFNALALACFEFQFEHNDPYRRYCQRRQRTPTNVHHWLEIPAVPTAAFKEAKLVAGDARNAQAVFRTSGTTRGAEKRGAHYVLDLELYRGSLLRTFRRFVMPDAARMPILSLVPGWQSGGESSLAYMAHVIMAELASAGSINAIGPDGIDHEKLEAWLHAQTGPVCIIGTSLAFVHWFEQLNAGQRWQLPPGSRIMDTGGFKGSRRAVSGAELKAAYQERLGVPIHYVINEYGMTEMLSQFYDVHLIEPAARDAKAGPPWLRTVVVDPESLQPLPVGEIGLLRHIDLANVFSVSAIQTEDMGHAVADGFQLLGRAPGAMPRGCSIAMDMFLSTAET